MSFDPSYLLRMISQIIVDPMSWNRPVPRFGLADVGVMTDLATATAPRRLSVVQLARMSLTRLEERDAAPAARYFALANTLLESLRATRRGGRTIASRSTATSVRVCLASRVGAALISRGNGFGQVAVPHAGRWTHVHEVGGLFSMTSSLKSDATRSCVALGIPARFGCRGVRASAIGRSHGWRRSGTDRSVERGTTRSAGGFATGGVALESLHVGRHVSSNHRVEVNRHQPSCLLSRPDSMIVTSDSNVPGQVAVTHPGR